MLPDSKLGCIGPVKTVYTVGPYNAVLTLRYFTSEVPHIEACFPYTLFRDIVKVREDIGTLPKTENLADLVLT